MLEIVINQSFLIVSQTINSIKQTWLDPVVVGFFWELRMPSPIPACEELACAPSATEAVPEAKTAEHVEAAALGHQKR